MNANAIQNAVQTHTAAAIAHAEAANAYGTYLTAVREINAVDKNADEGAYTVAVYAAYTAYAVYLAVQAISDNAEVAATHAAAVAYIEQESK